MSDQYGPGFDGPGDKSEEAEHKAKLKEVWTKLLRAKIVTPMLGLIWEDGFVTIADGLQRLHSLFPNFDHPATLGCLLGMLRTQRGDPTLVTVPMVGHGDRVWWMIASKGEAGKGPKLIQREGSMSEAGSILFELASELI